MLPSRRLAKGISNSTRDRPWRFSANKHLDILARTQNAPRRRIEQGPTGSPHGDESQLPGAETPKGEKAVSRRWRGDRLNHEDVGGSKFHPALKRNIPRPDSTIRFVDPGNKLMRRGQEVVSRLIDSDQDMDEWDTISALEQNRRDLDWREHLKEPEDWDKESDLDRVIGGPEKRFIELYTTDLELWEALYHYRFEVYGMDGAKMIWKHLNWTVTTHPMRVWERPRLWNGLLQAAFDNDQVLNDLISHCTRMAAIFNDKPDHFYLDVMSHVFSVDPQLAHVWHEALQPTFQPDKNEIRTLFAQLCEEPDSLRHFNLFCFELEAFTDMYKFVLGKLIGHRKYEEAVHWHEALFKRGDRPARFDTVVPLLTYLRKNDNSALVHKIASQLHESGVTGGQKWLRADSWFHQPKQELVENGATTKTDTNLPAELNFHDLPAKQLSDAFVARLIATSFFAITTILNGLSAISITQIGPLAFRELILRLASLDYSQTDATVMPSHVRKAESLLETAEMGLGTSNFSALVQQLATEESVEVLQSIMKSDQHPEVLDDLSLQESLLARYVERGAQDDIRRTLAILSLTHGQKYSAARVGDVNNLQIIHAVLRLDKNAALSVIEDVVENHRQLTSQALSGVLYELFFTPRRNNFAPKTFAELDEVTDFMKRLQQRGYNVPLKAWVELVRRRMWTIDLIKLEELLMWQYQWVSNAEFRMAHTLPDAKPTNWAALYRAWSATMNHGERYENALFNLIMQVNLIRTGFAADFRDRQKAIVNRKARILMGSHEEKVQMLTKDKSLWGLRLMKRFRDMGVQFQVDDVRKACAANLAILFGPRLPKRGVHRQIQMGRKANWTDYAAAMESIWGEQLFMLPKQWTDPDTGKKSRRREPSSSPTRLQDYCKDALTRYTLRSRLFQRSYWRSPGGVEELRPKVGFNTRYWLTALPFADTDEFLKTLVPELNPRGKLKDDPLLKLTKAEVKSLTSYDLHNRGVALEGQVKEESKTWQGLDFKPQVTQDSPGYHSVLGKNNGDN